MSRATYAEISHKLTDALAKTEADYNMSDLYATSNYSQIKNDLYSTDAGRAPTLELNRWILGDVGAFVPDDTGEITWGVWSNSSSDDNGDFETDPELDVAFSSSHTSSGITFTFAGDTFPQQVTITWLSGSLMLASRTFTVDAMTYFADLTIEDYDAVKIVFTGMQLPYRRLKIAEIDFGEFKAWGKEGVISANILEEVNPSSSEVTINTLDFTVYDEDEEFNMLNPSGVYASLKEKQELTITEYVDGKAVPMGKFYLETWENSSSVVAAFTAYDVIGYFDTITYKTSPMWHGETAGEAFAQIFNAIGWSDFFVEESVASELVYGYIPVVSVREALHQLCFALRAACIPNRNGTVEIKRLSFDTDAIAVEKSRKYGDQSIKQNTLVNSVAVTAYNFAAASSASQLYSAELAAGVYDIAFSEPAANLSISGGTINSSGINYANITVESARTVTITGHKYESSTTTYTCETDNLADSARSQATADGIDVVSPANGAALAQFLYEDYRRRVVQSFGLILENEAAGDIVDVDTMLGARKTGIITKMNIDLTGGFIADCEVRG